ncbi:unnamed protein product [Trifolium pratense]|uniref:Uncharacterized protein n=1 Tax=Trifolium pratense TaxID=57577 RepID=A0ACB0KIS4_TRIPR|nr:unnamed protein product [Trifolium pratense]
MEKKTLQYLPHELIIKILLRLPGKSLICFKCVSKLWYSLISNPHFANLNFQLATHTRRIMCVSNSPTEFCSIDFEAFLNYDPHPVSFNINFSLPRFRFPVEINGSCRGFICLYSRPNIFIWNPSTGFKKQIPLSPFVSKVVTNHIYGFGYDRSRDDYLVVVLSNDPTVANNVVSSHLEFFSIRDNRWKEIEGPHSPYDGYNGKGLLFNGAIHWLAGRLNIKIDVIVAFDLMDRKLFEIPLPDYFHQVSVFDMWVFGEFFSLWARDCRKGTIEVWVMKEYKLNSSWTKTLVLPLSNFSIFNPICSNNNGDIIGTSQWSRLVKSNNKGQPLEFRSFRNGPHDIVMYTESLLSLPGDNEQYYKVED